MIILDWKSSQVLTGCILDNLRRYTLWICLWENYWNRKSTIISILAFRIPAGGEISKVSWRALVFYWISCVYI